MTFKAIHAGRIIERGKKKCIIRADSHDAITADLSH